MQDTNSIQPDENTAGTIRPEVLSQNQTIGAQQVSPVQQTQAVSQVQAIQQVQQTQAAPQMQPTQQMQQAQAVQNAQAIPQTAARIKESREFQVMLYRYQRTKKRANFLTFFLILLTLALACVTLLLIIPHYRESIETSAHLASEEQKTADLTAQLQTALADKTVAETTRDTLIENVKEQGFAYDVDVRFMRKIFPDSIVTNGTNGFQFFPINTSLPLHSYDWSHLKKNGSVTSYKKGTTSTSFGVDVSKYQKDIDWQKVKNAGVKYAFIRVGFRGYGEEGTIVLDEYFDKNMREAHKNGIHTGAYFFTQATTEEEAKEEADFVIKHLKGHHVDYPIVFDTESVSKDARAENLSVAERTAIAKKFCDTIAAAGYTPMLYASLIWYVDALDLSQLTEYQKWYAGYEKEPGFPYDFQIWQYSSQGYVDGIPGRVDVNMSFLP